MAKTARNFLTFILLSVAAPLTGFAASQTIAFDTIPDQILGVSPFPIVAMASSLLPVTFVSATPTVCKNAGALVMVLNIGTCSITASQSGNTIFNAATTVTQSFSVKLAAISGSFKAATGSPFFAGTAPESLATADFNGDGALDIAAVDALDNDVRVLLGNGSGGFTADPSGPFSVGSEPWSVVAGDFNADGKADLAVANLTSDNVTVLLGTGTGGFTQSTGSPFAIGTSPFSMAVADVNGDGIQDLITVNNNDNSLTVLIGNGSGGFTASSGGRLMVGTNPFSVAVGDFNGDGFEDLAVANLGSFGSVMSWYFWAMDRVGSLRPVARLRWQRLWRWRWATLTEMEFRISWRPPASAPRC